MKTLILAAIRCSLIFLVPSVTYAISAQWHLDPISGDWNAAANWTPMGVPNGAMDTAAFGLSNTTNVSISENTEVNGIEFTPAATNSYTITATDFTLTISGVGITNNSGTFQHFEPFGSGQIRFTNNSTAGSATIFSAGESCGCLSCPCIGVPDAGSTLPLLGFASLGLATLRRKLSC